MRSYTWIALTSLLVAAPLLGQNLPEGFQSAVLPTETQPAVVGSVGEIWLKGMRLRAPLIAEQTIRAARGIVRAEGAKTPVVLALVVIGPVTRNGGIPTAASALAWCDLSGRGTRFTCYQDLDGDGYLDAERTAVALNFNEPLSIVAVGPLAKLGTPIIFRAATEGELPSYRLVYESCGGGGLSAPRFAQRVRGAGGGGLDYGCTGAARRLTGAVDGAGTMQVDRITVSVDPKDNSAETKLITGIPARTLLDRIMPAEPVVDLGQRPSFIEEFVTAKMRYARPAFQFAEAPTVRSGGVDADHAFAEARLSWGYTGKVAKTLTITNLTSSRAVEAGTPVYGVPMGGGTDGRLQQTLATRTSITWCAPRRDGDKWEASCLPVIAGASHTIIQGVQPAFLVTGVSFLADTIQAAGLPQVDEGPVEFGAPVALKYRAFRCSAKRATVTVETRVGGATAGGSGFTVQRGKDGLVRFALGGGVFHALPGANDNCIVMVLEPPQAGGNALPTQADGGGEVR